MAVGSLLRRVGKLGLAAKLALRSFTGIDTNPVPAGWTHVTKVDPEDDKQLPLAYPRYLGLTSAISVGGSRDVTSANTEATFELLSWVETPAFHEPSAARHVTERTRELSAFLAIPEVLNGHSTSIVGRLGEGAVYLRGEMVPELLAEKLGWLPGRLRRPLADFVTSWLLASAVFEAYIIQNVDSAAAREAGVTEADRLSAEEAAQRALAAEKHLESPVVYLEYSGTYGGEEAEELLAAIQGEISWSRLWYGGGIASREGATRVLEAGADTVVVGNVFHDVAEEELALAERAREALGADATLAEVEAWLDESVGVEGTSAARYLSTVPEVSRPTRLAREYLAEGVCLHLALGDDETVGSGALAARIESGRDDLPADYLAGLESAAAGVVDGSGPRARALAVHAAGLTADGPRDAE